MTITSNKNSVWNTDDNYKKVLNDCMPYLSKDLGELYVWGSGNFGQSGTDSITNRSSPIQIPGSLWQKITFSTESSVGFGIKSNGTLWGWGDNRDGELAQNNIIGCFSSPVQIPGTNWCYVSAGSGTTVHGIKSDNSLWGWGCGTLGRLGDDTIISKSSPVQIPGSWSLVENGDLSAAGIKTDGTLWTWGCGINGQLGDGTIIAKSSPVQIPGTFWCSISSVISGFLALKTDNTLWGWGCANLGRLGDNNPGVDKSSPIQIPGNTWVRVSSSTASGSALKSDGSLWVWGCNVSGRLGDGTIIIRSSPVQIPGNWCKIDVGQAHAVAVKSDETGWAWGTNSSGRLGDGTVVDKSSPVQIPGSWFCLSAGTSVTAGLLANPSK